MLSDSDLALIRKNAGEFYASVYLHGAAYQIVVHTLEHGSKVGSEVWDGDNLIGTYKGEPEWAAYDDDLTRLIDSEDWAGVRELLDGDINDRMTDILR